MTVLVKDENHNLDTRSVLLSSPIYSNLPLYLKDTLYSMGSRRIFKKGRFLFMEGERLDCIYFIISGTCREYYSDEKGEEYLSRIYEPYSFVSLHSAVNQQHIYSYSCRAINTTTCFTFPAKPFLKLATQEAEFCFNIATILSNDYEITCRKNCLCKKTQAVARVAGYLLRQHKTKCIVPGCECRITPCHGFIDLHPISMFAHDISLSRETFSRSLRELHAKGIINNQRGMIHIIDTEKLKMVCGI